MKKETFEDYGIYVHGASGGNVKTKCPQCSGNRSKQSDPCLSVDVDEGVFNCHHCGWAGSLKTQQENNPPPGRVREKTTLQTQPLTPDALKWLQSRGISKETAEKFGLTSCMYFFPQLNKQSAAISFPFYRDNQVVNRKIRSTESKAFTQIKGGKQILFNYDGCLGDPVIVLTEGELDALAVRESGFDAAVCSCPNGAPPAGTNHLERKLSFVDDAREVFDHAESVILAADSDEAGIPWSQAIADNIGREKCRSATWPEGCKDANDVLIKHGAAKLRACLESARSYPVPGIMEIEEAEDEILNYWQNGGLNMGHSTGFPTLDEYLRIDTGTLNVLTGIPMSGKSEFLDQLVLNTVMGYGWTWAVYSPENYPLAFHFQKLAEKYLKKPMFVFGRNSAMNRQDITAAINKLSQHLKILTFGEKPANVDELLTRAKVCKRKWGINGLVIDPYNELDHARPGNMSETEYISDFLSRMRNFGRLHDCSVWIVAHPVKLQKLEKGANAGEYPVPSAYDISGSAHWRNKADVCVALWRSMKANDGQVQVHVQKVRNKNLGRLGRTNLVWDRATGTFSEPDEPDEP